MRKVSPKTTSPSLSVCRGGAVRDPKNRFILGRFQREMKKKEDFNEEDQRILKNELMGIQFFNVFLAEERKKTLLQAENKDIMDFLNILLAEGMGQSAITSYLRSIRSFYGHFFGNKTFDSNPVADIRAPKTKQRRSKPLSLRFKNEILLERFRIAMRLREGTMKNYVNQGRSFGVFLAEGREKTLLQAEKKDIIDFLNIVTGEGMSLSTVGNYRCSIKSIYDYLFQSKIIASDPSANIRPPKIKGKKPEPVPLTKREVETLLAVPNADTRSGLRDIAIMAIQVYCGLRASETTDLLINDVNFKDGFVIVREGKGGRGRKIPLVKGAAEPCRSYFDYGRNKFPKNAKTEQKNFFLNRYGEKISRNSILKMVKKHAKAAGLPPSVSPHVLRHTFASNDIDNDPNIEKTSNKMGHANISTTVMYLKVFPDKMEKSANTFNPRSAGRVPKSRDTDSGGS